MENLDINGLVQQGGIIAVLVFFLKYFFGKAEKQDTKNDEREKKLMDMIESNHEVIKENQVIMSQMAHELQAVIDIKNDVSDIKSKLENLGRCG